MKKMFSLMLIPLVFYMFISCDYDFDRGKRPFDYPESYWESTGENYKISFKVGCPEEHIIVIDETQIIVFEFLWSSIDSRVSVYEYGYSGNKDYYLFGGECTFEKRTFKIKVDTTGEKCDNFPDVLVFKKFE